ncbi:alpha-1,3-mannosyl-glycoprotein 4-beta-N-acetylglucosaminyltransferase B-like [Centruroides vittatus]|uniref:alpha-1,3-mannosyl-glycoprotein 4-beta-N-acetylglucosaminyltransferase B-like n=1 Tax=Centruroides vittatus TaxID=120091 RepID=UPI00350EE231
MKVRRAALVLYTFILVLGVPFFIFFILQGPDLAAENLLQQRIAELHERLRHAEMLNQERRRDILTLRHHFGVVLENGNKKSKSPSNSSAHHLGRGALWKETQQYLSNSQNALDLQLPSIHHYLPHLVKFPDSLQPVLKLSKGRTGVNIVLGIPTVKRQVQSYLLSTLQNLIENMSPEEKRDTLIVVFIGESDQEYINKQASEIENLFYSHIASGMLEVIAPPANYYPEFKNLRKTLGDPIDRVRWRTKQNLDFAYLMMYAQARGTFYVQLEDDILTKPGYLSIMKSFARKQMSANRDWLVLDFCQLGFIGKMFKCADLPKLVAFFSMFHNDKPVDWLLDHLIQTKVCRFDKDVKDCKKRKDSVWLHYKPSLFQHVGTHSSLKGKVQKLKDKQFGKLVLHHPHKNPLAEVKTSLKAYKSYTLHRAYRGETYFWSLLPQEGDNLNFHFTPPVMLEKYFFRSGNAEHPEDKFVNTTVEILPASSLTVVPYPMLDDGFLIVGRFNNQSGIAEGTILPLVGPIAIMRLTIHSDSDHWILLSEIHLKVAGSAKR